MLWMDCRDLEKLDEHRTMQLLSLRKAQHWAKPYKDRAKKLIAQGKMHASGICNPFNL